MESSAALSIRNTFSWSRRVRAMARNAARVKAFLSSTSTPISLSPGAFSQSPLGMTYTFPICTSSR